MLGARPRTSPRLPARVRPALAGALLLLAAPAAVEVPEEAVAALREGRPREAVTHLERALTETPDDHELRRALVRCELALGRHLRAAELAGEHLPALRGEALFLGMRYEAALPLLDRSDPRQVVMALEALEALGRAAEAATALEEAERVLGPDHVRVLVFRGRRAAAAGDAERAVGLFRRASERDPLDAEALFGLGRALVAAGARDQARDVLQRHRELVPKLDRLEFARRGLELAPDHAPNHAAVGDAERALGRTDAAEASYRRALELADGPELVPVALRLARLAHEDRGDLAAALDVLGAASARAPDVRLDVRAGDLLLEAGRAAEAELAFEQALRRRPGDPAIVERLRRAREEAR